MIPEHRDHFTHFSLSVSLLFLFLDLLLFLELYVQCGENTHACPIPNHKDCFSLTDVLHQDESIPF